MTRHGRVPHGTKLHNTYKGREYKAEVRDGAVLWNGRRFKSLSQAAVAVIQSTGSQRQTESGFRFWSYLDEQSGQWKPLQDLFAGRTVIRLSG